MREGEPEGHLCAQGAEPDPDGGSTRFRVWAPRAQRVELLLYGDDGETVERTVPLEAEAGDGPEHAGYHRADVDAAPPGRLYRYRLHRGEGGVVERPDPASRHQPRGVHGPSAVVARRPPRTEGWRGLDPSDYVLYELHVGTFTDEGTFDAAIPHLDGLADLGVTAVELLPVAQFPGERNWGYDGVYPYAVQHSYGGPEGLRRFVAAAHQRGLAVVMDAVYNHLGPEGNYLADYGPYFTRRYATPWGDALNLDGPGSDPVRRFFVDNAVHWLAEHDVDALRLDAVHAIFDNSERPFLAELAEAFQEAGRARGRRVHLFAESALNTLRFLRSRDEGGCGMDGQWSDDFHHALHVALTGEGDGYYTDFAGVGDLAKAYRDGWVYTGAYSRYRGRRHGVEPRGVAPRRLVAFIQNHDQTGNRLGGDRLAALVDAPSLRLAATAVLLSPFTPLLFMGEEYGEERPFQYFVSHGDPDLVEAVRRGRADEFAAFGWTGEVPDPQAEATFRASKLDRSRAGDPEKAGLRELHRELLRLRREVPALGAGEGDLAPKNAAPGEDSTTIAAVDRPGDGVLVLRRRPPGGAGTVALVILCFASAPQHVEVEIPPGSWRVVLDSEAPRWRGQGEARLVPGRAGVEGDGILGSPGRLGLDLAPRSALVLLRGSD